MKVLSTIALGLILLASQANATCTDLPTGLQLPRPDLSDNFRVWSVCLRDMVTKVNDAAASTFTVTSSTFGHIIQDEGVNIQKEPFLDFVGPGVTVSSQLGRTQVEILAAATGDVIRSTSTRFPSITISSDEWVTMDGSTATLVMEGSNFIRAELACNLECTSHTACEVAFGLMMDGDFFDGVTSSTNTGIHFQVTDGMNTSSPESLSISYKTTIKPSPGSHTFAMLWTSGQGVPIQVGRNTLGCSLTYREEPETLNTGSQAIIAGVTNFGSQSIASLQSATCTVLPCQAQGNDASNFDLWVATGNAPGQWLNTRTGEGP